MTAVARRRRWRRWLSCSSDDAHGAIRRGGDGARRNGTHTLDYRGGLIDKESGGSLWPRALIFMPDPIALVTSPTVLHRQSDIPIFKVQGFDGYDFAALGVTDHFLDNAAAYFEKYTNPAHFRDLYRLGLKAIDLPDGPLSVLDIGTGGGNSIFAIYDILGKERVNALGVDISPQLLELCGLVAERDYALDGCSLSLLCANLYDLDLKRGSVDLVTGSSILHHMLDPQPIVELTVMALKPGGSVIFTEPFEDAYGILRTAYATITSVSERLNDPLPEDFATFIQEFSQDFDARRGIGDVRTYTQYLDDKWYFTRSWFQDLARALECDVKIIPTHGGHDIFWNEAVAHSRLHNGADAALLPEWAQTVITGFDQSFSPAQINEFAFTGIVIFTKR